LISKSYIEAIKSGDIVAFPTETVYGLGADAWNPSAIQKVFSTKGRPSDNPLIVHISEIEQVRDFASEIPDSASLLMEAFWPGPLTLVLKKVPTVLDVVTAGLNTVAIRMPNHSIALEFISKTGPLVAPSANTSGKPSPTKAEHVLLDFGSDFPVIDGGATSIGLESTVLDLTSETPTILRPGAIGKSEIEAILEQEVQLSTKAPESPKSPGQKYSHYKPNAEVRWFKPAQSIEQTDALFLLQNEVVDAPNVIFYHGDLAKMAREIYDRFRQADVDGYKVIYIESLDIFSSHPMYSALINRIAKAVGI
tara:strand:+ start:4232 stop:5155 length:924 start_codon:yes stop_codon:yes gene_type:complete